MSDLTDHEADFAQVDPNGTMASDLLDAWYRGDEVFDAVLRRCLTEFDLAVVIAVLVSMNHALIAGHTESTGISIDQYLAGLRADYQLVPPHHKETTTP